MNFRINFINITYNRVFEIKILKIKVWNYISGSASTLIAVLLFGKNISVKPTSNDILNSIIYGASFFIAVFIILFLFCIYLNLKDNLYLKYFTEKNNVNDENNSLKINEQNVKFIESIKLLNEIFLKVHNFKNNYSVFNINKLLNEQKINDDFIETLFDLCINLKKILELFNDKGMVYSISIKIPVNINKTTITNPENNFVDEKSSLLTICRDPESKSRESDYYINTKHTILGNTAFSTSLNNTITRKKLQYYINNDIQNSSNYLNTSLINNDLTTIAYKSELVFPLIAHSNNNYNCKGFICCDCSDKNGFKNELFIEIIKGVCDGIYDFFLLKDFVNRKLHLKESKLKRKLSHKKAI